MLKPERHPLKILPDKILHKKVKYHAQAIEGLTSAPDSVNRNILLSSHARRLAAVRTELVSFKRMSKRKI